MPVTPEEQNLLDRLKLFDKGAVQPSDLAEVVDILIEVIKAVKNHADTGTTDHRNEVSASLTSVQSELQRIESETKDSIKNTGTDSETKVGDLRTELLAQLENLEQAIGGIDEYDDTSLSQRLDEVEAKIPTLPDEETAIETRDKLETLKDDDRLDMSAVKGLENLEKKVKEQNPRIGSIFGARGVQLYVNDVKKGLVNTINLVPGTNITITHNTASGRNDITISSSGGSGSTPLVAMETPDGNRTVFTFSAAIAKPSYIYSDNVRMAATGKDGVTVNWSWNSGAKQATMTVAPSTDIEGVV